MSLKVGIVGLPNAGKSTLFNALLKKQQALAASYPFATIEPNTGVVPVPDPRLEKLAEIVEKDEGKRPPIVPATIEFVDIAGLVKGAAKGEGLGNKFLAHIREVDMIAHVVRLFDDPDVVHTAGSVDPTRDREIVESELILADLETLEKQAEPRGVANKEIKRRWELIAILKEKLGEGKLAKDVIKDDEQYVVKDLHLLTNKPVLYVLNVSEDNLTPNKQSAELFAPFVVVSAKIESELAQLPEEEQNDYLKELGLTSSGLDRVAQKAYEMLGLISFLTMGIKEVRAWTLRRESTAVEASGVIHTDFMKKFIKAEVISYDELVRLSSRKKAKEIGKLRLEGRDYVMQDGDVVEFKIGS